MPEKNDCHPSCVNISREACHVFWYREGYNWILVRNTSNGWVNAVAVNPANTAEDMLIASDRRGNDSGIIVSTRNYETHDMILRLY